MPGSGQLAVVCFGRCCAIRKEDVDKRRDQRTRPDRLFDDCGEARLFARQTALRADIRGHRNDRRKCIRASPIANGLEDLVAGGPGGGGTSHGRSSETMPDTNLMRELEDVEELEGEVDADLGGEDVVGDEEAKLVKS